MRFPRTIFATGGWAALVLAATAGQSSAVTLAAVFSAQVEEDEIDVFSGDVDQAFFNVQGDDDAFTVYSISDFAATVPVSPIAGLSDVNLRLTQSNAGFSASGGLEFFLATDTRAITIDDAARYVTDGDNVGSEVVGDAFGTLFSLGTGTYTLASTGDTDAFPLTLSTDAEAFLVGQINSGGTIRIIGTPADLSVQATYSGATSLLDPPSPPQFSFTVVPEPGSGVLISVAGFALIARRRRG